MEQRARRTMLEDAIDEGGLPPQRGGDRFSVGSCPDEL